jgi:hypothetical protein
MRTKSPLFLLPLVAVTIAALSGCAGSGAAGSSMPSAVSAQSPIGFPDLQGGAKAGVIYLGNGSSIDVFKIGRYNKPERTITDCLSGVTGEAVDGSGNLYEANAGGGSCGERVEVFAPGASTPFRSYGQGGYYGPIYDALGIAVSKKGALYVADGCCSYGTGYNLQGVVVYPPGGTSPSAYLYLPNYARPFFVALDAKGDVFVSNIVTSGHGAVFEFAGGSRNASNLGLQNLGNVAGIVFDDKGNLLVADWTNGAVDVYPPGSTTYSRQIKIPTEPIGLAFTKNYKQVLVTSNQSYAAFQVVDYASGKIVRTVEKGCGCGGYGIAVSPAAFK